MFGIMHNHFVDGLRASRRQAELTPVDELPEVPVRATQSDGLEVRDLDRCLRALPPEQREVLLLVCVEAVLPGHRASPGRADRHGNVAPVARPRTAGRAAAGREAATKLHRVK